MESLQFPSAIRFGDVDLRYLVISQDLSVGRQLPPSGEDRRGCVTICFPNGHVDRMPTATTVSDLLKTGEHLDTSDKFRHALIVRLPGGVIYAYVLEYLDKAYLLRADAGVDFDFQSDQRTLSVEDSWRPSGSVPLEDLGLRAGVVGLIGEWNAGTKVNMQWHPEMHEIKNPICNAIGLSSKVTVLTHSFFMTDGVHSRNVWPRTFSPAREASTHILASSDGAQPVYYPPGDLEVDWTTCKTYAIVTPPATFAQAIHTVARHPLVVHSSSLYFKTLQRCDALRIPQVLESGLRVFVNGTFRNGAVQHTQIEIPFVPGLGLKVPVRGFKSLVCLMPARSKKVETFSYNIDSEGMVASTCDTKVVAEQLKRCQPLPKLGSGIDVPPQALEGRFYLLDNTNDVVQLVKSVGFSYMPPPSLVTQSQSGTASEAPERDLSEFDFKEATPTNTRPPKKQTFMEVVESDSEDNGMDVKVAARGRAADVAGSAEKTRMDVEVAADAGAADVAGSADKTCMDVEVAADGGAADVGGGAENTCASADRAGDSAGSVDVSEETQGANLRTNNVGASAGGSGPEGAAAGAQGACLFEADEPTDDEDAPAGSSVTVPAKRKKPRATKNGRRSRTVEHESESDTEEVSKKRARRTAADALDHAGATSTSAKKASPVFSRTRRKRGKGVRRVRTPAAPRSSVNTVAGDADNEFDDQQLDEALAEPGAGSADGWPRGEYGRDDVVFVLTAKRKNVTQEKAASEVDTRGLPGFDEDRKVRAYTFKAAGCATLRDLCRRVWMDLYASLSSFRARNSEVGGTPRLRIYYDRSAANVRFVQVVFGGQAKKGKQHDVKLLESTWTPGRGFAAPRQVDGLLDRPLGEVITPYATLVWDLWKQDRARDFNDESFDPTDDMVDLNEYPLKPSAAYIGGAAVPAINESTLALMPEPEVVDQVKWNAEAALKLIKALRDATNNITIRNPPGYVKNKACTKFLQAVMGDEYKDKKATEFFLVNVFIELWDYLTIEVKRRLHALVYDGEKYDQKITEAIQQARKIWANGKDEVVRVERLHKNFDDYIYNVCLIIRLPIVLGQGLKAHTNPLSISSYDLKPAVLKRWEFNKDPLNSVFNGLEPVVTTKNEEKLYTALRAQDVAQKAFSVLAGDEGIASTLEDYYAALEASTDVMETLDITHGVLRFTAARREHHLLARGAGTSRLEVLRSITQRLEVIQARVIVNVGPSGAGKTASCVAENAVASQCQAGQCEDADKMLEHGVLVERLAELFDKLKLDSSRTDAVVTEVERRVHAYMDGLESRREEAIDVQLQEDSISDEPLTLASGFSGISASGFVGMTTSLYNVRTEPLRDGQQPRLCVTLHDSDDIIEVLLSDMGEKPRRVLLKVLSEVLQPKPNQDHGPFTGMDTRNIDAVTQCLPGRCWTTLDAPGWNDNDPRAVLRTDDALRMACIMTRVFMRTTDRITTATLKRVKPQYTTAVAVCNTVDKQPKRSLYQLAWGTDMAAISSSFRTNVPLVRPCLFRTNSGVGIPAILECGDLLRRSDRLVKLPACLAATQSNLEADHRYTVFVRALRDLFDDLEDNLSLQAPELVGENEFFSAVSDLLVHSPDVGNRLVQRMSSLPAHESLHECIDDMGKVTKHARRLYDALLAATNAIVNTDDPLDIESDKYDVVNTDEVFKVVNGSTDLSSNKREHLEAEFTKFITKLCDYMLSGSTLTKYIASLHHRRDSVRESVLVSIQESLQRSKEDLCLELRPGTASEIVSVKRLDGRSVVGAERDVIMKGWRHVVNRISELVDRVFIAAVDTRSAAYVFDGKCLVGSLRIVLVMILRVGNSAVELKKDMDKALNGVIKEAMRCLDEALMRCPETVCSCLRFMGVRDTNPRVNDVFTRIMKLFVDKAQTQLIADKIGTTLRECKESSVRDLVDFGRTLSRSLGLSLTEDVERVMSMDCFWEQKLSFNCVIDDDVPQELVEATPAVDLVQWFKDQTGHQARMFPAGSLDELMTAAMNNGVLQSGWWTAVVDSVLAMMGEHLFPCFGGPNQRPYLTASNLLGAKKEFLPCFVHDVAIWEHIVQLHKKARGGQGKSFDRDKFVKSLADWAETTPVHALHASADYLLKDNNELRDHLTFTAAEFARLNEIHGSAYVGGELNMARFRLGVMKFRWDDQQARLQLEMRVAAFLLGMKVFILAPDATGTTVCVHVQEPSVVIELDDRLAKFRDMYFSSWKHTVSLELSKQSFVLAWNGSGWCGIGPENDRMELDRALLDELENP